MKNDTILSVENLTISFRTINGMVRAVRGISFDLKRGETVAIVGESAPVNRSASRPLWVFWPVMLL